MIKTKKSRRTTHNQGKIWDTIIFLQKWENDGQVPNEVLNSDEQVSGVVERKRKNEDRSETGGGKNEEKVEWRHWSMMS